jgi:hypothetical protein
LIKHPNHSFSKACTFFCNQRNIYYISRSKLSPTLTFWHCWIYLRWNNATDVNFDKKINLLKRFSLLETLQIKRKHCEGHKHANFCICCNNDIVQKVQTRWSISAFFVQLVFITASFACFYAFITSNLQSAFQDITCVFSSLNSVLLRLTKYQSEQNINGWNNIA